MVRNVLGYLDASSDQDIPSAPLVIMAESVKQSVGGPRPPIGDNVKHYLKVGGSKITLSTLVAIRIHKFLAVIG